jgi:MFS family permease
MVTYRSLFTVREFRFLYSAQVLSQLGDQVAAVAVAVLVYDRTGSGLLTALAYASAWLPGVFGGPLLGGYADRFPRRQVMIICDLARAALLLLLTLPAVPVVVIVALLFAVHSFEAPFSAARSALMPEVLEGSEAYITGNGLGNISYQVCQILGLSGGGVAVAYIGPKWALLADAATFLVAAALVRIGVRHRPSTRESQRHALSRDAFEGLRYVFSDPWLRNCLLLVWSASAFSFAPEAIAYPYARHLGVGQAQAGLMLAAPAVGMTVGGLLFTRILGPTGRDRMLFPAAIMSTGTLLIAFVDPPLLGLLALLVTAGFGAAFTVPLNSVFVRRVVPAYRGRAMGVAIAGLMAAQGLGFLLAGTAVQAGIEPPTVIVLCGAAGTVAVLLTRLGRPGVMRFGSKAIGRRGAGSGYRPPV